MSDDEQAKASEEEGQSDKASKEKPPPLTPPAIVEQKKPVEKPAPEKESKGEEPSEDYKQKYQSLEGMFRKAQEELNQLKSQKMDFEEVKTQIASQGHTMDLVIDTLSALAEDNEEVQRKVTESKQKREEQERKQAEVHETVRQMGNIAKVAKMQPDDESLKPAWEAVKRGDRDEAIRLTTLAAESKISTLQFSKPAEEKSEEEKPPPPEKKKLPVVTSSPAPSVDWRDKPSKQKIEDALKEWRDEQGINQ